MEILVINLLMKESSIFNERLFRFCIVSWKDPSKSGSQRSLEEKDRTITSFKATEILTESVESRLNSSGTSS